MIDLKAFRKANKMTQADLAKVLGTSRSFVGQVECGASKLPDVYLQALLANKEFDTSMLFIDNSTNISAKATGNSAHVNIGRGGNVDSYVIKVAMLEAEIESLKIQLSEEKQRSAQYWEMIQKLMK